MDIHIDAKRGETVFLPQEKVVYGESSLVSLSREVDRLGAQRVLIITGQSLATRTPVIKQAEKILSARHAGTYAGIKQHAPESGILEALSLARERQVDLLVSIGGGSPIDAAKSVAFRLAYRATSPGRPTDYLPQIAIPTTLSAAEFSHLAGYTDETMHAKTGFADPLVTPRVVILDPEVTKYTPMDLWLASGMRSVDHAVETLYSPGFHPLHDRLALHAIQDLFEYLPRSKAQPEDLDARLRCQLAAWMSFFHPASVKMGLSHALGRRVGASFDVSHGVTSCIFLPVVMRAKAEIPEDAARLAPMARPLNLNSDGASDRELALMAAGEVAALVQRLELPSRLRDVGVPREALDDIARSVPDERLTPQEVASIVANAW